MFSKRTIRKEVRREYDANGKVVRETTILEDGGLGQEEAEKRLKETENLSGGMDRLFDKMGDMFKEMDNMFKKVFK